MAGTKGKPPIIKKVGSGEAKKELEKAQVKKDLQIQKEKVSKDGWELKDRQYYLLGDKEPVSRIFRSRFMWFDGDEGMEREVMLTSNQQTEFVDEFKGQARLEQIIFRDGVLNVPANKVILQKVLAKHPENGKLFKEKDNVKTANEELARMAIEDKAIMLAANMDIDKASAIVRVEVGSSINQMTTAEIKRDLKVMARKNPSAFIKLANDENIEIRNNGIRAVEQNMIRLEDDNMTFTWASTGRTLCKAGFDQNPYSALAEWFKTNEGVEVYRAIMAQLGE